MSFYVVNRWGGSDHAPSSTHMAAVLAELDVSDPEHPDAWLVHESGWTLTVHEKGIVIWENPDIDVEARHMINLPRARVLELWESLALGHVAAIEREPWQPGDGIPPLSADERREIDVSLAKTEKDFYDSLGAERADSRCRADGCMRGAVIASAFCRVHHYEQVRQRPSPFTH